MNCKKCGVILLLPLAIACFSNSFCESCHKKLEDNPDELIHNFVSEPPTTNHYASMASVSGTTFIIDSPNIINKNNLNT